MHQLQASLRIDARAEQELKGASDGGPKVRLGDAHHPDLVGRYLQFAGRPEQRFPEAVVHRAARLPRVTQTNTLAFCLPVLRSPRRGRALRGLRAHAHAREGLAKL